jgi:hypothetical protein
VSPGLRVMRKERELSGGRSRAGRREEYSWMILKNM